MKLYQGEPGGPKGGRITVRSGRTGKPKPVKFRPSHDPAVIGWGKNDLGAAFITLALLDDLMPDQPDRALRLMQRVKWRLTDNHWKAGMAWTVSEDELKAIVDDVERVAREVAPGVRQAQVEPVAFQNVALPKDVHVTPGKDPTLVPQDPKKARPPA